MNIEFLVATTNRNNLFFLDRMFEHVGIENVNVLVINQCIDIDVPTEIIVQHKNIRVISVRQKGTSVSRNLAIENMQGDICTFTDDDLIYESDVLIKINEAFSYMDSDILTFKTGYIGRDDFLKEYKDEKFNHDIKSLLKVGDWEIFFKSDFVKRERIRFDERFGLGCLYPACEYHIFLVDSYRKKGRIHYNPIHVVNHPHVKSTGLKFERNIEIARGAGIMRMLGFYAIPACVFFALKKHSLYKEKHSLYKEIYYLFCGCYYLFFKK